LEEKPEHKKDATNLFKKLIQFQYTIVTAIWKDILECFSKTTDKLQTHDFDIYEGYLLLSTLYLFITELKENSYKKLMECETKEIKMSNKINTSYSDIKK
jgi:hypothetical protein